MSGWLLVSNKYMKRSFEHLVYRLGITLVLLGSCTPVQTITQRYPSWGEEVLLPIPEHKTKLHLRIAMPKQPAYTSACILIVHGMNEYVGRYVDVAKFFSEKYIVAGVDLRGHGLTNPVLFEADRAIARGVNSFDAGEAFLAQSELTDLEPMRQDLDTALKHLVQVCDQTNSARPLQLFIVSHSLGSLVTASYMTKPTREHNVLKRVGGVIFTGPAFSVTRVPGWRGWFQNPFIRFSFYTHEHFLTPHSQPWPEMVLSQIVSFIAVPIQDGFIKVFSLPVMRRIFSPKTPDWVVEYLSNWDEEKQRHRADNYIIRQTILNYVLGVEKEIIKFRREMAHFTMPYFLIYSAHDPITPAWGMHDFATASFKNHPDNELLELPDQNHHEQLFSAPPLNHQLLQKIDQWISKRLA